MTRPTPPMRRAFVPLALLLPIALAGCGGGDDGASPAPTATVTVTASPSPSSGTSPSTDAGSSAGSPSSSGPSATVADSQTVSTTIDGVPTTYAEAAALIYSATPVTGGEAPAVPTFTTPSGNIFCATGGSGQAVVGCEIGEGGVDDPTVCPDNPMTTVVGRLEVHDGTVQPICNTDTIRVPGATTLQYGTWASGQSLDCVSEQSGVTCVDPTSKVGFFLARGRYRVLS